jgi:type IV pilus assembly protein PilZ
MAKAEIERARETRTPPQEMAEDRRRYERTPLVVRVDYSTVDAFFSEFTSDVNEGGLFIETDSPAGLGTEVLLKFLLPGTDEPVKVVGRVVWTSHDRPSAVPGMGVEFGDLDAAARATVNRVVQRLRSSTSSAKRG